MKKIKFIAMAMLALLTAQCKKNEPEPEPKVMVPISGSVSFGGGSKTEITTTGYVTPKSGDMIYIYHAGDYVGSLTCTPGTGQAFTCSGEIEESCLGEACTFMYLGSGSTDDEDVPIDGTNSTISFANQTGISGSNGEISGIDKFHVGSCKANVSEGGTVSLPMRTKISIAYFQLKDQNGSAMANNNITISGVSATATINKTDGTLKGKPGDITVHTDANGCFYMALVPQSDAANFTFTSANANGTDVFPYGIGECCFYSEQGNVSKPLPVQMNSIVTPDLLPGMFSVSADKYVQFSRGNLFCTRSGSEGSYTYEFGLENNQYDFRTRPGYASVINGVYAVNGTGANMSGHFYWDIAKAQAGKDYGAFSTTPPSGGTTSDILDWGPALDAASHWTTLSRTEWNYLISTREVKSATGLGYTCQFVYFKGVDGLDTGVDGLIIYPDDYDGDLFTKQQDITAIPYGCVFIPMAGIFTSGAVINCNNRCNYWTSSHGPEAGNAYQFLAYGTTCHANNTPGRANGLSVRLVQRFPKPEIEPTFVDLGLPSGTLWADVNVGATALTGPGSYGKYYSFGETAAYLEPMTGYGSWAGSTNPNYVVGDIKQYTSDAYWKWNGTGKYNSGDIMLAEDDIATQKYGEGCHIPTLEQWTELFNTSYCSWTNVEGGVKVTSKTYTGRSIFIPKSGYYNSSSNYIAQTRFWSSDYWDSHDQNSVYINNATSMCGSGLSAYGSALTIRAVKPGPEAHEYVEIGGLKWATTNIGADTPKDYGWYFSWGGTTGYVRAGSKWVTAQGGSELSGGFSYANAPYNTAGVQTSWNKYIPTDKPTYWTGGGFPDNKLVLDSEDDAADINWGDGWRMPTQADFQKLYEACGGTGASIGLVALPSANPGKGIYWVSNTQTYISDYNGVAGILFCDGTSKLFFVAAGYGVGDNFNDEGSSGRYWSGAVSSNPPCNAYYMAFISSNVYPENANSRNQGFPIRPVHD